MSKKILKPGNMVYPLPAALVSCADKKGNTNLLTVAWTGTICSDPAMLYISVRPERFSHHMLMETKEFVLNLTTEEIIRATDMCGVKSGADVDKWKLTGLTPVKADKVSAPLVKESPVNIECKVTEVKPLGSHDMFIAEVVSIHADEKYFDKQGRFDLNKAGLVAYSHGGYMHIGKQIGSFGYSVRKESARQDENYKKELETKQKKLEKLLGEYGKLEPIIGMDDPMHYRNKVHHVFAWNKKLGTISGSYKEGTHKVINENDSPIDDVKSQEIIKTIRELCKPFKIKTFDEDTGFGLLRHVLVRRGFKTGEIMVVLVCASQVFPGKNNFVKALLAIHPEITTIVLNVNDKKTSFVLGDYEKTLYGPGYIKDELCGCIFKISPKSFYQVNPVQTDILYRTAIEYADLKDGDSVLDAYCGIGTIGLCAAMDAKSKGAKISLTGVELNADAVKDAKTNAKINEINDASFIAADATKWIVENSARANVVFMDPPRSGSTAKFIKTVSRMKPDRVVYISCGPDTLARDLEYFKKYGYEVRKMQPIDMFPFTEHVETVVLLSQKNV